MDCNKRMIFYPLDDRSFSVYKALRSNGIDIIGVSTQGSGYVGKSVGSLVNREEPMDVIRSIDDINFDKYNTILLSSSVSYELNKDELECICTKLKNRNLDVYYYGKDENVIEVFKNIGILLNRRSLDNLIASRIELSKKLNKYNQFKINVPVVYIGGLIESYDSFDISLQLKHEFEQRGFICAVVSNNHDAKIIGAVGYPQSFMGTEVPPHEQIADFNLWVSELDFTIKPDIVLFDVPKGIMQLSNITHNTFGIYLNMMYQTIPSDFLIVTIPIDFVKAEVIKKVSKHLKILLGRSPDIYHISNALHDVGSDTSLLDKPLYIKEKLANDILRSQIDKFCEVRIEDVIYTRSIDNITDLLIETYRRDKNE